MSLLLTKCLRKLASKLGRRKKGGSKVRRSRNDKKVTSKVMAFLSRSSGGTKLQKETSNSEKRQDKRRSRFHSNGLILSAKFFRGNKLDTHNVYISSSNTILSESPNSLSPAHNSSLNYITSDRLLLF